MIKRTLYFGNPAYLSMQNQQLVLRLPEIDKNINLPLIFKKQTEASVPIEDIGMIVIDHRQITITHDLCETLIENNAAIVWCNSKHHPVALTLPMAGNDTHSEKTRFQIEASESLRKQLWKQTIEAKILNQATVLEQLGYPNDDLKFMAKNIQSGDTTNVEGRAAARYWEKILAKFNTTRGQFEAPPNNYLNYGYAILRACVARSLVCSGLLPVLGIHHHNKYNAYCLADDIMEPYRPFVDKWVLEYIEEEQILVDELGTQEKRHLLNLLNIDVLLEQKTSPLMIATQRTTASLMRCYTGESRKISYPVL